MPKKPTIGREYESALIREAIQSDRAELGIIYGRRRIGKSYLLKTLIKESRDFYFEAIRGLPLQEQIKHFCKQLAEQTQTVPVDAKNWQEAFDTLSLHIKTGVRYVVFDEFPWMASERKELVSILKYYWDNKWKTNGRLTLVLCGSVAQFMIQHVLHSEALHNRKTFELRLEPLPSWESQEFFKGKRSLNELTRFLMIFGGVPKYLEQVNPNDSLSINLDKLCFQKAGFFVNEFETIFKEQFKVIRTYETIVRALAKGALSKEQIAKTLNIKAGGGLATYLKNLEAAEFIKKQPSLQIGKGRQNSKTFKYVLWDEWLKFYFTYMETHAATIQRNVKPGLFLRIAGPTLPTYYGLCFERFCQKNITKILEALAIQEDEVISISPVFKQPARKKKSKGAQIDLAILRRGQVLTLIECKFKDAPVGLEVATEMKNKIKALSIPKSVSIEKVLISASGATEDLLEERYFNRVLDLEIFYR